MPSITAPTQNRVLNDANITEIIVEDTTTFSHYQANIYIDNVLFDSVVMPKIGNQQMILTFENLLLKYISLPEVQNVFIQRFALIRDLKVTIARYAVGSSLGIIQYTLNYKLKYSVLPTVEKYEDKQLAWIAVDADVLLVQPNTIIQLPFFIADPDLIITAEAVKENGTVITSQATTGSISATKTLLLTLPVNVPDDVDAYFFRIKAYNFVIEKKIRVVRNGFYKPKRVRFYNRFGMPILVELFGKLSTKDEQTYFKYQNGMGYYNTAEIQTDTQVAIDTGHLLDSEKAIINQIISSLKVEIEINGAFIPCVATLKTIPVINENEFINSAALTFEFNKSPKIKN